MKLKYAPKRKSVPQIVNYGGFQQLSGTKATCPLCLGDMCGCQEDLVTKGFRICKGCKVEVERKFGYVSDHQIRKAIKKLTAKGLWDRATHSVPIGA
jgi:hypothetical protein